MPQRHGESASKCDRFGLYGNLVCLSLIDKGSFRKMREVEYEQGCESNILLFYYSHR
jgi:hypothetical protein